MIDEADRDGDGEISEEEFMRIMKKTNLFWEALDKYITAINSICSYL
jgi:hypothetical protein